MYNVENRASYLVYATFAGGNEHLLYSGITGTF